MQPLALPVSAEIGTPAPGTGMAANGSGLPPELEDDQGAGQTRLPGWMNEARSQGAQQAQTVKTVGSLVQDNPKQAALIVRDWLSTPAATG
jgi:flagellar M-ring protein FliF